MRRNNGTLNGQLSRVISELGHTDRIIVTDAGLPIPPSVERVDLALRQGIPAFLDVFDAVLAEVQVQAALLSSEIRDVSPEMLRAIEDRLGAIGVTPAFVPHEDFKQATAGAKAAVRSGEFTPFANVLLTAGVVY
jgi:D-ribose pyranase